MKLPNGYGSIYKLPGNRRLPWTIRITLSCHKNYPMLKKLKILFSSLYMYNNMINKNSSSNDAWGIFYL